MHEDGTYTYKDPETLRAYLELKERKTALESAGAYTPTARAEISREFMRLLSYPDRMIANKLASGGRDDPFIYDNKGLGGS